MVAPSGDGHDFRMGPGADDDDLTAPLRGLADNFMDALDKGTGGVQNGEISGFQFLIDGPADTVAADDDGAAVLDLRNLVHLPHAHFREALHHMAVVDDGAQGHGPQTVLGRLLHHGHGPVHAEAEPRRLGKIDLHPTPSPSL